MPFHFTCQHCGGALPQFDELAAEHRTLLGVLAWPQPSEDVREIPLTKGAVALVDAADFPQLARWNWFLKDDEEWGLRYAVRMSRVGGKRSVIRMHVQLMGVTNGLEVDHINRNGLDNRRSNLRLASHSQNAANTRLLRRRNSSGLRGVSWSKFARKWRAQLQFEGRHYHLGYFTTKEAAAAAYNAQAVELFGDFAVVNPLASPS